MTKYAIVFICCVNLLYAQEDQAFPNNPIGKWNIQLNAGVSIPLQINEGDVEFELNSPGGITEIKFDYALSRNWRIHLGARYSFFQRTINTNLYSEALASFDARSHYIETSVIDDPHFDITEFLVGIGYDFIIGKWVFHPGFQLGVGSIQYEYTESMFVKRMDEHYWFESDLVNEEFGTTGYSVSGYLIFRRSIWSWKKINLGLQVLSEFNYNNTLLTFSYSNSDYLENSSYHQLDVIRSIQFFNGFIGVSARF